MPVPDKLAEDILLRQSMEPSSNRRKMPVFLASAAAVVLAVGVSVFVLGVHVEHELMESIRLAKFCPTPDGAGAHVVLETADGPVTMFYMPRSQAPDAPRRVELPDGMEGWLNQPRARQHGPDRRDQP